MKVLQVNNKFIGAGAENVMKTLGDGLSEKGHEYSIEQGFVFTILERNERP